MHKKIQRLHIGIGLAFWLVMGCAVSQSTSPSYPTQGDSVAGRSQYQQSDGSLRPHLQQWASELAQLQSIPLNEIEQLLQQARYDHQVIKLMRPSPEDTTERSWQRYKRRFIEPVRIEAGLAFWQQHETVIQRTAEHYGVPAEIIVAIIGVETIYGRYTGDFNVLDALITLGFSYPDNNRPERGDMFRKQLADLIVLHHQGKLDATEATGSYAGAMGLPQFMPGSLRRYAVDADDSGEIDLYNSIEDITASVANFLIEHGWQPDLPVFAPVRLDKQAAKALVDGGLSPTLSWQQIQEAQAIASPISDKQQPAWANQPLGVINLVEQREGTAEYRLATPNFFAITSYNRNYFYAATVADFAQRLFVEHTRR